MRQNYFTRLVAGFFAIFAVTVLASPMAAARANQQSTANELQDVTFGLTRLPENPRQFSLVISDADEHVITGSFSVDQLQILRAIMIEAEKFAMTAEAVGSKEPITTRFSDKQEPAFIVDVQKSGNLSMLFLTLKTETGRMTWAAGRTVRTTRRDEGFFFDLLSRLESTLPKLPQPSK